MKHGNEKGFTLIEGMVSLVVLAAVGAIVMTGISQMIRTQGTIANRTEMHTSVRSATELLEQEIGQAGKISLPSPPAGQQSWLMTSQVTIPNGAPFLSPANIQFSAGLATACNAGPCLFDGEFLVVDAGNTAAGAPQQETIQIHCAGGPNAGCTTTWNVGDAQGNGSFYFNHNANVPVTVRGAFSEGIIPPAAGVTAGYAGYTDANGNPLSGSTATTLKMYGDINGDGNIQYVEYTCVPGVQGAPGFLYRNSIPFNAGAKPALAPTMTLLTNVLGNPGNVPCFQYQVQTVGKSSTLVTNDYSFVTDVAVTLTEQTQNPDPQTRQFSNETKALLNVSPRNVFNAFELASQDYANRVQRTPSSVINLLP